MGGGRTLLATTLLADLRRLQSGGAMETFSKSSRRAFESRGSPPVPQQGEFVWPVTLFPREGLYHSPRDAESMAATFAMSRLRLLSVEPPGVRPPGASMHERVASPDRYRLLPGLLWTVAMHGPRPELLSEIGGRAAYRVVASKFGNVPPMRGATSSTVLRLEREPASLSEIARWPGMSAERASRILNAIYLCGGLMISRAHPAARSEPKSWRSLLGRRK